MIFPLDFETSGKELWLVNSVLVQPENHPPQSEFKANFESLKDLKTNVKLPSLDWVWIFNRSLNMIQLMNSEASTLNDGGLFFPNNWCFRRKKTYLSLSFLL